MSSKLVKKSLELVSGNSDKIKKQKNSKEAARGILGGQKRLGKINKTKKNRRRKLQKQILKKKGKTANSKTQLNTEIYTNIKKKQSFNTLMNCF